MTYEILTFKFNPGTKCQANVLAKPNKAERFFLRKRQSIMLYEGRGHLWCDEQLNFAPLKVDKLLSAEWEKHQHKLIAKAFTKVTIEFIKRLLNRF